jgi:hypothetical protein
VNRQAVSAGRRTAIDVRNRREGGARLRGSRRRLARATFRERGPGSGIINPHAAAAVAVPTQVQASAIGAPCAGGGLFPEGLDVALCELVPKGHGF